MCIYEPTYFGDVGAFSALSVQKCPKPKMPGLGAKTAEGEIRVSALRESIGRFTRVELCLK